MRGLQVQLCSQNKYLSGNLGTFVGILSSKEFLFSFCFLFLLRLSGIGKKEEGWSTVVVIDRPSGLSQVMEIIKRIRR